jgi:hypothetical protein
MSFNTGILEKRTLRRIQLRSLKHKVSGKVFAVAARKNRIVASRLQCWTVYPFRLQMKLLSKKIRRL